MQRREDQIVRSGWPSENQKKGVWPLDERGYNAPKKRQQQKFVSRLYWQGTVMVENRVLAEDASDATSQSRQDRLEDAENLIPDYQHEFFCGRAKWISDPE